MMKRKGDKRAQERVEAEREFTSAFGHPPPPTTLQVSHTGYDPQRADREAKRLAARVDPTKAGACRVCGQRVEPGSAVVDGWRCCPRCEALIPLGLPAVVADALGITEEVTEYEAFQVAERVLGNPCRWLTGWPSEEGTTTRWAHVDPRARDQAATLVAKLRDTGAKPNATGRGCAWCGIARSETWTQAPWSWSRSRDAPRCALCEQCAPLVQRSGAYSGNDWRPHLLAAITGMRRPSWDFDLGVLAFFESGPADLAGTRERWGYLGETRARLRRKVIRQHPRLVELTEVEARVLSLEQFAAEVRATPRSRLADV